MTMQMMKKPDLRATWEQMSSDEIDAVLERSANFRELRLAVREGYLNAMRGGSWEWANGQTVVFDRDGLVVDGQHRLSAISVWQRETGNVAWLFCVRGVDRKRTEMTIDIGVSRKFSDYCKNSRIKNAKFVQPITASQSMRSMMPRGEVNAMSSYIGSRTLDIRVNGKVTRWRPSITQMVDTYQRNRGSIDKWAAVAEQCDRAGLARAGLLGCIGFHLDKVHAINAGLFFSYLIDGAGLKKNDPILGLRERLRGMVNDGGPAANFAACVVKAWRMFCTGTPYTHANQLRWVTTGRAAEDFPDHNIPAEKMAV